MFATKDYEKASTIKDPSPKASSEERLRNDAMVRNYFPGAMRNNDTIKAAVRLAESLNMTQENTLFSYSICPDEINHNDGELANILHNHFGPPFSLGGLGGIPFSGKTGFGAYASHVPDNGNIFVLFAPHCAVAPKPDREFGE